MESGDLNRNNRNNRNNPRLVHVCTTGVGFKTPSYQPVLWRFVGRVRDRGPTALLRVRAEAP